MDLFSDLNKGSGCGPQQGAVGNMANQMLRTQFLQQQQQGGASAHMGAHTAQWRQGMEQAMQGPQMGGPLDGRFEGPPPPMMQPGMSMPAASAGVMMAPAQARAVSMAPGNWTSEFHAQQQQHAMSVEEAMMARAQMTHQQQHGHQLQMMQMQQQQQRMMMQRHMMMMQQQQQMAGMGPMMMQPQQHMVAPAQQEQQDAQEAPAAQDQDSGTSKEQEASDRASDPLQSEAYRRMQEAWDSVQRGEGPIDSLWNEMMAMNGLDSQGSAGSRSRYQFNTENKFISPDTKAQETFEEGVRLFKAGRINDAVLAFEAVVQLEEEHAEAWRMLGQCHADHDEDQKAIVCLEKSAECDAYNLPTLLALGVCYVNELDSERALANLKAWVEHNPDFIGLEVKQDPYSDGSLVDEVMNLMLQVQAHDPTNADVQEVLGVLYNVSKDFDHAIAAFKKALEQRPDDYALWNKLGATQANSDRSEEAMPAYHRALELKPRYARGLLNLGISHSNIGSFEEAMR